MKKGVLLAGGALCISILAPAWAQPGGGLQRLDTDGDGLVSEEEFAANERRRGPRIIERADTDGDGAVTRDEVQEAIDAGADERKARMSERMLEMFDAMDANEDGVVTREEAEAEAFARIDSDGDGYISADEAQAMRDQRQERRGRGKGPGSGRGQGKTPGNRPGPA